MRLCAFEHLLSAFLEAGKWRNPISVLGYEMTRQKGSHIRVTTQRDGENHEVIPLRHPIKTGTLSSILKRIAAHHGLTGDDLLKLLDL